MQEQQPDGPRRIAQALLLLRVPGYSYERRQLYRDALRQLLGLLAPGNGPDEPLVNCAASRHLGGVRVVAYLGPEHQTVAVRAGKNASG